MGRTSKAKQLEEQETANQERLEHSEKVQQLAKLRSLPPTICDCPSHASYRMWCPTGDITIPKCAKRCPFCTFEARACNITAFLVRKHMKDTHLHTERFWGLRILTAPSMESMLFPMSSTDEGAPEENHNPFSPRSHSERQVSGETPIKREIPATADRKRPIDDLDATSKIGKGFKVEKAERKVLKRETLDG
ncbi:hypothetical protein BJX66DRAFT_342635 [Aspergillus keveii]|uniref:C2H2 finger domain protein n=1 Tax=Aspergillus keveii TaxID=714993 RepID=A0ABR4FRQ4_9EURO